MQQACALRRAYWQGFPRCSLAVESRRIAVDYRRLSGFQALAAFQRLGTMEGR
jgi:hypothetical protein